MPGVHILQMNLTLCKSFAVTSADCCLLNLLHPSACCRRNGLAPVVELLADSDSVLGHTLASYAVIASATHSMLDGACSKCSGAA